jgi:uncharacterized protein (TIGR02646 family)
MHRLVRPKPPPRALEEAKSRGLREWEELGPAARREIRTSLGEMQGWLCAYCEAKVEDEGSRATGGEKRGSGCHVEHWEKRADNKERQFDWKNLFLSCNSERHCGKDKDKLKDESRPNYELLIDPCEEDPEDYLRFDSSGRVSVWEKIPEELRRKAEETIRVFNLNEPGLVNRRKGVISGYLTWLDGIEHLDDDAFRREIRLLEDSARSEHHTTAVYHAVLDKKRGS